MKLEKATTGDIILSCLIPGWGLLIGLIALVKREYRRALNMILISSIVIAILVGWRLLAADEKPTPVPTSAVSSERSIESELLFAANELTRSAPKMADADTRFDGAVAGPGLTFTYLYTLPGLEASKVEPGAFEARLAPDIKKSGCQSAELKVFFDRNVQVRFDYRGNDGNRVGTVLLDR